MQINAINHKENTDYLDPYDNVEQGIKALHKLAMGIKKRLPKKDAKKNL